METDNVLKSAAEAQLEVWDANRLQTYARSMNANKGLWDVPGLLLNLRDALNCLSYNSLGELVRAAEAAKKISPVLKGDKLCEDAESLRDVIRMKDAEYTYQFKEKIEQLRKELGGKEAVAWQQVIPAWASARISELEQELADVKESRIYWRDLAQSPDAAGSDENDTSMDS